MAEDKLKNLMGLGVSAETAAVLVNKGIPRLIPAFHGKAGTGAGWAAPSAANANTSIVGLPASTGASHWVIPISGLKVGDTITAFSVVGQIESAGNAAVLDADLRKLTVAAADFTDASIGAITQISKTADYAINDSKTLATPEVVAANEQYYVLITATTLASTDIQLAGITLTVQEG